MPYKEVWYPKKKKREDAEIGGTTVWPAVERAKEAGVTAVQGWKRNKTIGGAAQDLRCYDSVNAIRGALGELVRQKKRRR